MNSILLIDDNTNFRNTISDLLELNDYRVYQATDGIEALLQLNDYRPDLIICDLRMPQMDGFTFLQHLRENARYHSIPVIMLTASTELENRLKGLQYGAIDYLTKPFITEELLLKIARIIQLKMAIADAACLPESPDALPLTVQFVRRVNQRLESDYIREGFQLNDLAEELGMSRSTLQRNLKRYFHKSFHELLKEHRLRKAATYLTHTDFSVQVIAAKCGFSSQAYFARSFKEAFQESPLHYRSQHCVHPV